LQELIERGDTGKFTGTASMRFEVYCSELDSPIL
jgi:hypothetical protein